MKTHGLSKSKEYTCWVSMKNRCTTPSDTNYRKYGAKGIGFCDRWRRFENFLEDMGKAPTPKHSIDRINSAGNYEPSNCRWATMVEQQNNRRSNRIVYYDGRHQSVAQWCRELGLNYEAVRHRIHHYKWPVDKAFTTKVISNGKRQRTN